MRTLRPRYALSLLAAALALLAGGGLDWALEWTHNRLLGGKEANAAAGGGGDPRPRTSAVDAVVVLGYALARDGTPSAALEHRVRAAVREWERASREGEGRGAKLLFSGGHPGGGVRSRSEAAVMAAVASELPLLLPVSQGQKEADWLLEEASTSTWENAVESLELLSRSLKIPSSSGAEGEEEEGNEREEEEEEPREKRRRPVVLSVSIATSPFHQRRALATFRCAAARRRERMSEKEEEEEEGKRARGEKSGPSSRAAAAAAAPAALAFSFSVADSPRPPPRGPLERVERAYEAAREVAAIGWYRARGRLCGGG